MGGQVCPKSVAAKYRSVIFFEMFDPCVQDLLHSQEFRAEQIASICDAVVHIVEAVVETVAHIVEAAVHVAAQFTQTAVEVVKAAVVD